MLLIVAGGVAFIAGAAWLFGTSAPAIAPPSKPAAKPAPQTAPAPKPPQSDALAQVAKVGSVVASVGSGVAGAIGTSAAITVGAIASWAAIAVLSVIVSVFVIGTESARLAKGRAGALADLTRFAEKVRDAFEAQLRAYGRAKGRERVVATLYAWGFARSFNNSATALVAAKKKSPFLSTEDHFRFWADRAFFVAEDFINAPGADPRPELVGPIRVALGGAAVITYDLRLANSLESVLFRDFGGRAGALSQAGAEWTGELERLAIAQGVLSWVMNGQLNNHTAFAASPTGIGGEFSDTPIFWPPDMAADHYRAIGAVPQNYQQSKTHLRDPSTGLSLNFAASDKAHGPVLETT